MKNKQDIYNMVSYSWHWAILSWKNNKPNESNCETNKTKSDDALHKIISTQNWVKYGQTQMLG